MFNFAASKETTTAILSMEIKENIKYVLHKRGMTQVQLAEKLGVSKQQIQSYLNTNITLETLRKIAVALDTTMETLVSETPLYTRDEPIPGMTNITSGKLTCPHCGKEINLVAKA